MHVCIYIYIYIHMHTYLCWDWVRFYDQNNMAPGSEQMGPGPWRTMGGSVDSWSPSHDPHLRWEWDFLAPTEARAKCRPSTLRWPSGEGIGVKDDGHTTSSYGGFHKWWYPKWLVYKEKSHSHGWFGATPISGPPRTFCDHFQTWETAPEVGERYPPNFLVSYNFYKAFSNFFG